MSWVKLSQSFHLFSFLDVFKTHIVNQLRDLKLTVSSQRKHFNHLATKPIHCFLSVWVRDYCFLLFASFVHNSVCHTASRLNTACIYIYICCDASSHCSHVKTTDLLVPHAQLSFLPRSAGKMFSFWHFNRHKLQSPLKVRLNIKQSGSKCLAFIQPFSWRTDVLQLNSSIMEVNVSGESGKVAGKRAG